VPYGGKSDGTVARLSLECIHFLRRFDPELIVVACNTASSVALPALARAVDVPVVGVVDSGVRAALAATRNGRIGVIGTAATVRSGGYERGLRAGRPDVQIVAAPCPLLVPLVEEGWIGHAVTQVVQNTAPPASTPHPGCTHYPLLKGMAGGSGVTLIDTGGPRGQWPPVPAAGGAGPPARHRFFVSGPRASSTGAALPGPARRRVVGLVEQGAIFRGTNRA
jgi:glutamate racemase